MAIIDQWGNPYRLLHGAQQTTRRGPVYEVPIDDFDKLVPSYDRKTVMAISNRMFMNYGIVRAAIRQKAYFSVGDAWLPKYLGKKDAEAGRIATDFLRNIWLPNCEVRGGIFDWWKMWTLVSEAADRDGDSFIMMVMGSDNFPRLQMIPAHRCYSEEYGVSTVLTGQFRGLNITDGIIHYPDGRVAGYRFNLGESGDPNGIKDIPAAAVVHLFDPTHITQKRGLPGFAHAVEEIKAIIASHADERQRQMIISRLHLMVYNQDGVPDDTFGPSTKNADGDITRREFAGGVYYLPTDGSKIEQIKHDNPGVVWESFQDRLTKIAVTGYGWTTSLLFDHADQGTGERTEIVKARKAISERQSLFFFAAKRITTWAAQVFASQGRIPFLASPSAWDFSTPPRLSVDDGRESRLELEELRAGSRNLHEVLDARGLDEDDFLSSRAWSIAKRKIIAAKVAQEASKSSGVEIEISPQEMFMMSSSDLPVNEADSMDSTDKSEDDDENEDMQKGPAFDELKSKFDAYGVAVRAGAITPSLADEESFRREAGLPAMSNEVKKAWSDDKGIRRPITLVQKVASAFGGGQPQPTEE